MSEHTRHPEEQNIPSPPSAEESESTPPPEAELREKLDAALKESALLKDQLLRKAAEFENYKRRTEGEFKTIVENATERLLIDLLPILDDFDRFLKSSAGEKEVGALREGLTLISNKMNRVFAMRGLTPFESLGKPFDVHFHDALLQIPRADVPPNTVVEEVARGYALNDRVLRHAKVVVSASASHEEQSPQPGAEEGTPGN
jgi:molecular chaperone GrpE